MKINISKENFTNFSAKMSQKNAINDEDKTISFIALSKDNLHKRSSFFGDDYYLSVDTKNVNFAAKTLYLDHSVSFKNAIGKIEAVKNEDGDIKVVVKFDENVEESREAFARYKAGFSDSVSVGFGDYKIKEMQDIEGVPHYQICEGSISELSAVWQGADPNAKVAKFSKPIEAKDNEDIKEFSNSAQTAKNNDEDIKEIIALAKIAGEETEALNAIQNGLSYVEFSKILAQKNQSKQQIKEIKMTKQQSASEQRFNLAKIILGAGNAGVDLGYELENHYNSKNGRFVLPQNFGANFSDSITTTTTGAGAIATEFREDLLIEAIKKESPLLTQCSWLSGLTGRVEIPRNNSNITADFVEEGQSRQSENLTFDKIILEPHTIIATVRITRTMMNMSAFSLEKMAYDAMKFAIRKKLEESILYGKGVIKGIFEISGVPNMVDYLKAPTLEKTLSFADVLDDNGGDIENAKFALRNSDVSKLRSTPRSAVSEKMLIEDLNNLQGYVYLTTQRLKNGDLVFGDFRDIFIGSFGNIELLPHNERGGDVVLELFLDTDAKLAREKSFVISKTSL
ncbi:MAG: phage major capsid protein [Campylobacter sp.]